MSESAEDIFRKQGLLGPDTPELQQQRRADQLKSAENIFGAMMQSDVMRNEQLKEDRKEHGVLADAGRFIEEQPFLRRALGTAAKPLGVVANVADAAVKGVRGRGGDAAEALSRAGGLVRSFTDFDADMENMRGFTDVLESAGVGELGSANVPLLGRVTGRGTIGTGLDIFADPLRTARFASQTVRPVAGRAGRTASFQIQDPLRGPRNIINRFRKGAPILEPRTLVQTPEALDRIFGAAASRAKAGLLRTRLGRGLRGAFQTVESASETRPVLAAARETSFEAAQDLERRSNLIMQQAREAGEAAGMTIDEINAGVTGGAEALKRARKVLRKMDNQTATGVLRIMDDYRKAGFSPKESLEAARAVALLPEVDPILAPYASRMRRLGRDILRAEQLAGVDINALKDSSLFYMTRVLRPEVQDVLAVNPKVASSVQRKIRGALDARTPAQKRRMIYEGQTIPEINADMERLLGKGVKFFEDDPAKINARRVQFAQKGMTAGNFAQGLVDDFARAPSPALLDRGWVPMREILAGSKLRFREGLSKVGLRGTDDMLIPPEIAAVARPYIKAITNPDGPNLLAQMYDKYLGFWKTGQTVLFPEFHARNAFSNVVANYFGDVTDPSVYAKAGNVMLKFRRGKMDDIVRLGDQEITVGQLMRRAESDGLIGLSSTAQAAEELGGSAKVGLKQIALEPFKDIAGRAGEGVKTRAAKAPLRVIGAPFKVAARGGRKIGELTESHAKLAHLIDKLEKGVPWDEAAMSVKKHLFDYADLTPFEKSVMRRIFPFYTWTRKAIPMVAESMFRKPGKVSAIALLERAWNRDADGSWLETAFVPWHVRQQINRSDADRVTTGVGDPMSAVLSIFDEPLEEFANMLAPPIKAPFEVVTGKDIFSGRNLRGAITPAVGAPLELLAQHPDGKAFTDMIGFKVLKDERGNTTGFRMDPIVHALMATAPTAALQRGVSFIDRFNPRRQIVSETDNLTRFLTGLKDETLTPKQRAYKNFAAVASNLERRIKDEDRAGNIISWGPIASVRKNVEMDKQTRRRVRELVKIYNKVRTQKNKLFKQLQREMLSE